MKKKLPVFFVFFLLTMSYGQTVRYIYETSINPDSINLVSLKTERTFLDIKGNRSLFISEHKLIKDSLLTTFKLQAKDDRKKDNKDFIKTGLEKKMEPSFFEYFITKNIPEKKIYYYDRVGGRQIYYLEDRPIKWEITNVTENQNGYSAQKAVTSFGGRTWTAWFTKEIPVSDGPYKFGGLPGLIVKLEDERGDYKFDLAKKVIIQNSYEEKISPEAKESTRINFTGDKAAIELELNGNRKTAMLGNEKGDMGSGGGRRGGGMKGGGRGAGGQGMSRRGMGGESMPMSNPISNQGNFSFKNNTIQNPIELNK